MKDRNERKLAAFSSLLDGCNKTKDFDNYTTVLHYQNCTLHALDNTQNADIHPCVPHLVCKMIFCSFKEVDMVDIHRRG